MADTVSLFLNNGLKGSSYLREVCDKGKCLLHTENHGSIPLDGRFVEHLGDFELFDFWPINRGVESSFRNFVQNQSGLTKQACQRVLGGRPNLVVGLETNGGEVWVMNEIRRLMNYFRYRGGNVMTFVGDAAGSAGAEIFIHGDKGSRFMRPDSELMFHLGGSAMLPTDVFYQRLCDLLVNHSLEYQRENVRLMCRRARALSRDTVIRVSGEEADIIGFGQIPLDEKGEVALISSVLRENVDLRPEQYAGTRFGEAVSHWDKKVLEMRR